MTVIISLIDNKKRISNAFTCNFPAEWHNEWKLCWWIILCLPTFMLLINILHNFLRLHFIYAHFYCFHYGFLFAFLCERLREYFCVCLNYFFFRNSQFPPHHHFHFHCTVCVYEKFASNLCVLHRNARWKVSDAYSMTLLVRHKLHKYKYVHISVHKGETTWHFLNKIFNIL